MTVEYLRSFVCYICSKICQGELLYQQHVKVHLGIKSDAKNRLGSEKCRSRENQNASVQFALVCYICGKSFGKQEPLNVHINNHKQPKAKLFKSETEPILHTVEKRKRPAKGKPSCKCKDCGAVFRFYSMLRTHKREVHGIETEIKCDDCDKVFKYTSQLSTHKTYKHGKFKDAVFKCKECDKTYKNAACLRRHSFNHLGLSFICDQCSMSFVSKEKLAIHFNFIHKTPKYKCSECDYKSLRGDDLRNHINRRHRGDQVMFTCAECGNLFRHQYQTCKGHKEARKKNKGSKMIACENKCGFEGKWASGLKKHYSRSRCDPKNALIRNHKCDVCQRTFSTESRMKKHKKYHFEEKPHKCSECSATFIDSWGLKRHLADNVCNTHLSRERQRRQI